eukprot:11337090-Ditylum_brightwellii.AAC.1
MDQRLYAVVEAEATALAVVNDISRDNEEANDSSSYDDDDPIGPSLGICVVPHLSDLSPGPTFVTKFFSAFKYCHASTL